MSLRIRCLVLALLALTVSLAVSFGSAVAVGTDGADRGADRAGSGLAAGPGDGSSGADAGRVAALVARAQGPPEPWWVRWAHDENGNALDDELEARPWTSDTRFDVFVRLSRAPTDVDLAAVADVIGGPVKAYPLAHAVYAPATPALRLHALLDLPAVVAIEREQQVLPAVEIASKTTLVTFSEELGNGARGRWKVGGRNVVYAVLDTGIDEEHEAFEPERFLGGFDATLSTAWLGERLLTVDALADANLTTQNRLAEVNPDDRDGHGTAVAGALLGVDPNGTHIGVAPVAKFLDVKVFPDQYDTRSDLPFGLTSVVLEGLEFVDRYNRGETYFGDPGNDSVDVVTMSVAEMRPDPDGQSTLSHAVNRLVDSGVVVVAAAGNCGFNSTCEQRGNDTISAPGAARQAITVGAYDDRNTVTWDGDVIWDGSSQGPNGGEDKPNVVAPGVDIIAPRGADASDQSASNEYTDYEGTSMAVPIVAGVVGLLLEADPELTPDRVKEILMDTARDMGEPGWDPVHGAGAVNAYVASGVALEFLDLERDVIDGTGHEVQEELNNTVVDEDASLTVLNQAPTVAFEYGPKAPVVGDVVVFIDRSTDREGNDIASYNWDLGDGTTKKGERVAHEYERPGTYVVRLSVTDVKGASGYGRQAIVVVGPEGETEESPMGSLPLVIGALLAVMAVRRRATVRLD